MRALTAPSFGEMHNPPMPHNKALEITGDKLIEAYSRAWVNQNGGPASASTDKSLQKSALRSNVFLSIIGMRLGLDQAVRVSRERVHATKVVHKGRDTNHDDGAEVTQARLTADALEALVAAIHIDGGPAASKAFVERFIFSVSKNSSVTEQLMRVFSENEEEIAAGFSELTNGRGLS